MNTSDTRPFGSDSSAELGPLYPERDHMAQGPHYVRHVDAMTREGLHSKSRIAGELAARDIEIERLRNELAQAKAEAETAYDVTGQDPEPATDEAVRAKASAEDPGGEDLCKWSFERGWRAAEDTHGITKSVRA